MVSYDEMIKSQSGILAQLKTMEQKVDRLTKACEEKDRVISDLRQRVSKLENHSRRRNIEIHCVNENDEKDVEVIVCNVASCLGVKLTKNEIECAHRILLDQPIILSQ